MKNIYPIFSKMLSKEEKERQLHQRGVTLWFTGLSGSGKSTIAVALERRLALQGVLCKVLDGDNIRSGINSDLSFSDMDREENIRRTAEICKLFNDTGIVTIAAFVSPNAHLRALARSIIGESNIMEIYISTPLAECERRDVKGLYAKARQGGITDFTGISARFEEPKSADISIDTTNRSVESCVDEIMNRIASRVVYELQY